VIFQNLKIPIYTFCRRFNSEYQLWVLLRWYGALPLKASRIRTAFCNSFSVEDLAQISFNPRCVHCFTRSCSNTMFGVKLKFGCGRERVVDEEWPGLVLFRWLMQRSQQSILSCCLTSGVLWWKCLNEFGSYVEKWKLCYRNYFWKVVHGTNTFWQMLQEPKCSRPRPDIWEPYTLKNVF